MGSRLRDRYHFLPRLLQRIFQGGVPDTTLKAHTLTEQAKLLDNPEVPELDPGPAEAWRWTHLELNPEQFVCSIHCRDLRAWGYVMWDKARLDKSDLYTQPFTLPPLPDPLELQRRKDIKIASIMKRRQLWREGAEGWWDEEDQSHLTWRKPVSFSDDEVWDHEEAFLENIRFDSDYSDH